MTKLKACYIIQLQHRGVLILIKDVGTFFKNLFLKVRRKYKVKLETIIGIVCFTLALYLLFYFKDLNMDNERRQACGKEFDISK